MTLFNVCRPFHHYAHGGFSGKHRHQAVLNGFPDPEKRRNRRPAGTQRLRKKHPRAAAEFLESPSQGNISWRGEPLAKLNRAQRKAFTAIFGSLYADLHQRRESAQNRARSCVNQCATCYR